MPRSFFIHYRKIVLGKISYLFSTIGIIICCQVRIKRCHINIADFIVIGNLAIFFFV